jgi:hypothetical protein
MRRLAWTLAFAAAAFVGGAAPADLTPAGEPVAGYAFTYFTGNGEDGLHLATSADGLAWEVANGGKAAFNARAGSQKLMRDPCAIQALDGTFHLVWTTGWSGKDIGYARSSDLVAWTGAKTIPVMEKEPEARNCWAPEVFHDDAGKQFLLFWATTIPGRFPQTDGQDGKNNHRIYFTATKDFETFAPTAMLYDHGFNVIDATMMRCDGRTVMFLKDETNKPFIPQKNIRVAWADKPSGPWGKPSDPISGKDWAEGPTAVTIGGQVVVYFDKYTKGGMGAVRSRDLKAWEDISDQVKFPPGTRHGTALPVSKKILDGLHALKG